MAASFGRGGKDCQQSVNQLLKRVKERRALNSHSHQHWLYFFLLVKRRVICLGLTQTAYIIHTARHFT